MLKSTITVNEDVENLCKLFSFEDKSFSNNRAGYDFKIVNKELRFNIWAEDSVALRSVLNTITKIITVHEKTSKVLK